MFGVVSNKVRTIAENSCRTGSDSDRWATEVTDLRPVAIAPGSVATAHNSGIDFSLIQADRGHS
jgi:hypothetical protein